MTSADSLSLILRRLDEIERKLDRMMEELRPTAIGYSVRRGNRPKEGLSSPCGRIRKIMECETRCVTRLWRAPPS